MVNNALTLTRVFSRFAQVSACPKAGLARLVLEDLGGQKDTRKGRHQT